MQFIPNKPYHKIKRKTKHYHLRSRLLLSTIPILLPASKFIPITTADLYATYRHEYLHYPSFTIGPSFHNFNLDPLVYFRMLKSFNILSQNEPIPTFSCKNYASFLESTNQAFTFSNYVQVFPLILDTGASISITPVLSDFVEDLKPPPVQQVHGINSTSKIEGAGTVEWQVNNIDGQSKTIKTFALYLPSAKVRLFSPQDYFRISNGGSATISKHETTFYLDNDTSTKPIVFPYNATNGLPMIIDDMAFFQPSSYLNLFQASPSPYTYNNLVLHPNNNNISAAKKELLLWHYKLGHVHMRWIQQLLRQRDWLGPMTDPYGNAVIEKHSFIQPTTSKASSCDPPSCTACILAKSSRRGSRARTTQSNKSVPGLRTNHLYPGQVVSIDQYESTVRGRLPHTQGKEPESEQYVGGTIGVDHASSFIFHRNQVSLRAADTILTKRIWDRFAQSCDVKILHFRGDNGVFRSQEFLEAIQRSQQSITFSGVGAHHQNGVAERAIKTTIELARAMLLHAALFWPDSINESLWPFALDHAIYLWNNLPNADTGLTPTEIFTQTRLDSPKHLARMHVWGCPAYVLEPKLQDGKKIPKWRPRARRGQYLGISTNHSTTVGIVQNLRTGNVTPQYHVVYDDNFYTVASFNNMIINDLSSESPFWTELVRLQSENYLDDIHENDIDQLPALSKDWREQDAILEEQLKRSSTLPTNPTNNSTPQPQPIPPIPPTQQQTIPSTPTQPLPTQLPQAPLKSLPKNTIPTTFLSTIF